MFGEGQHLRWVPAAWLMPKLFSLKNVAGDPFIHSLTVPLAKASYEDDNAGTLRKGARGRCVLCSWEAYTVVSRRGRHTGKSEIGGHL